LVKEEPDPTNDNAVITPEILAPEEVIIPLKFPLVAVRIPTEIPFAVKLPRFVMEFNVSVSV